MFGVDMISPPQRGSVLAPIAAALLGVVLPVAAWADDGRSGEGPEEGAAEVRALLGEDRWRPALERARALEEDWPGHPEAVAALGEALFRAGEIERASERLAVLESEPDAPARGLVALGLVRSAEGDHAAARTLMGRALEKAPEDPYVLYSAAGFSETRDGYIRLLERYLEASGGEDPDFVEAARGSLRLQKAIGEMQVWVSTGRPERLELPMRRIGDGLGYLAGFSVPVTLGTTDKPVQLLLDTGSPGVFLVERAARKRGFRPLTDETTYGGGGSGRHRSGRGTLSRLALGDLTYENPLVTTSQSGIVTRGRTKGLIGVSRLRGYRVTLDLHDDRLVLESPQGGVDAGSSPYWVVSGQLLVRVEAAGGVSGLFLLDTGANRTLLDLAFAERIEGVRLGHPQETTGYGGARKGARRVEHAVLQFQGLQSDKERMMTAADLSLRSRVTGVQISGFLGLDLLAGTRIVLDTVAQRVSVEAASD
jgi:predicted aspartyl protease